AVVAGFGGMRDYGETLEFSPRLPQAITRLCFRLLFRGRRLRIEIRPGEATYEVLTGQPLEVLHHGEPITLQPTEPLTLACPPPPEVAPVSPPPGREPLRRGVGRE